MAGALKSRPRLVSAGLVTAALVVVGGCETDGATQPTTVADAPPAVTCNETAPRGDVFAGANPAATPIAANIATAQTATALDEVIAGCRVVLEMPSGHSVQAWKCVADAQLKKAEQNTSSRADFEAAYCTYTITAELAEAAGSAGDAAQAAAHAQRARALLAIRDLGGGTAFLAAAIAAYDDSLGVAGTATADRYFARAKANEAAGRLDAADADYRSGLAASPSATQNAEARLAYARLRQRIAPNGPDLEAVWRDAATANPTSIEANARVGEIVFANAPSSARQWFDRAVAADATGDAAKADGSSYQAESHYYLSVIHMMAGRNQSAVRSAERAGSRPKYQQQECRARIILGGEWVTPSAAEACQASASPEGNLLKGMRALRRSQAFYNPNAAQWTARAFNNWSDLVSMAEDAFEQGLDDLGDTARPVDWDGEANAVAIRDALRYGLDVVAPTCKRENPDFGRVGDREIAQRFFRGYNAHHCGAG